MPQAALCPTTEKWDRIAQWQLAEADSDAFASHLEQCDACSSRIENLTRGDTVARMLRLSAALDCDLEPGRVKQAVQRLVRLGDGLPPGGYSTWSPRPTDSEIGEPAPSPPPFPMMGEYRLDRELGRGGMGVVYEAIDTNSERKAAVKMLLPKRCGEDDKRRFLREGKMLAAVKSDHVVTIYRVAEEQGVPFLAMEFLEGSTLEDWLNARSTPVTAAELVWVAQQVLAGLVGLAGQGLVHRDLKPSNLWVKKGSNRVTILDLGLGRDTKPGETITNALYLVGTPSYMSPEQANGAPLDARSDLFSVGVVLHRMAAGASPFARDTALSTLSAVANFDPPPLKGLPPAVITFIRRLMSKNVAERPESAAAALSEVNILEQNLKLPATTILERPSPRSPRKRLLTAAGVFALLATITLGLVIIIRDRDGRILAKIEADKGTTVEIINTETGKKTTVDVGTGKKTTQPIVPKVQHDDEELPPGTPIRVTAYTNGFSDSSSEASHPFAEFVDKGAKGAIIETSSNGSRCCVRLESVPGENIWILRDHVAKR